MRRDLYGAATVLERLTSERRLQRGHEFRDATRALVHRHVEHRELFVNVAAGHDEVDPSAAQDVENDDVLSQPQRIVERRDQRGDHEAHVHRACGHGREHRDRAREITVG